MGSGRRSRRTTTIEDQLTGLRAFCAIRAARATHVAPLDPRTVPLCVSGARLSNSNVTAYVTVMRPPRREQSIFVTLAELAIDTANSLTEVLNALLDQLAVLFSRAALFVIKGDRVQSWRGVGFQGSSADLRNFEVPLTATSPLTKAVRTGRLVVAGDYLDQNGSSSGEGVDTVVALPIRIADSVVAVAYADGGQPSAHEPPRIIRTSTLHDAETLVKHAVRRLTALLATSGVVLGVKAAPSVAPDNSLRDVSFTQSDDARAAVIGAGPKPAQRQQGR